MQKLPEARNTDIVVQYLGKEVLIYDLVIHKAYNLNETSSVVYQACDGQTSFDELKAKSNLTDEIIYLALDELQKENLLEKREDYSSPFAGMSRREAVRRVGLATMVALPVISGLIAPTASQAASGQAACTGNSANGTPVDSSGGGIGSNNAQAQAACFAGLDCQCRTGSAINKTIVLCAGASSAQTCVCNGTCAANCANPGGANAGTGVNSSGGGIGSNNAQAQAACLSNLNSQCCSGSATNTTIVLCAGASSAQTCVCNGTCS